MRCLLDFMMVLTRRQASKDFELLVLRHENAGLRRQILHDAGIGPAPRRTGPTRKQFLTARLPEPRLAG